MTSEPTDNLFGLEPRKVGVIGCGTISDAYFRAAQTFPILEITAAADLNPAAAERAAQRWGVAACTPEALLARDDVELVLNLTVPQAHAAVTLQALAAGKHVHLEKPLALSYAEGLQVVQIAADLGLRVSCAPDTFLGAGQQTCRQFIDAGKLGRVVAGTAFMMVPGHERWHPNPDFYYLQGGGPLFDMGPYYLTALVQLLGPVARVSAAAATSYATRTIGSEPRRGEQISVEVPTHVSGTLEFTSGALITLVMSFDVQHHTNHPIELHGERGSLQVPDPNTFGGPVRFRASASETRNTETWDTDAWDEVPLVSGYTDNMRGVGAADLASALATGRAHRCHSDLALHVLEVMQALHEAADAGRRVTLESSCERPAPFDLSDSVGAL